MTSISSGTRLLALAIVVAALLVSASLLRLADAHGDLRRACLLGGGTEYLSAEELDARAHPGESAEPALQGDCYHPEV